MFFLIHLFRILMPPKKAAPQPKAPPPKSSFFLSGNSKKDVKPTIGQSNFTRRPQFTPRRSFLYDQYTDEPYAEWIGNEAVCLETGEVLFESKRGGGFEDMSYCDFGSSGAIKFDFSPPKHKHPKDPSIASQDLIDAGILTLEDFRNGNAGLAAEAFKRYMSTLG